MRKSWADMAKAIAIIAVVVGHTDFIPVTLSHFIFSFHMPLFFILSGYFLKPDTDLNVLCKKNAKSLLLPYALTCCAVILGGAFMAVVRHESVRSAVLLWLKASLYGSGGLIPSWATGVRHIGAIWFLLALFVAQFVVVACRKLGKYDGLAVALVAYVGYKTATLTWLPLSIQAGMTAAFFVYLGMRIRETDAFHRTYKKPAITVFCVIAWAFCAVFGGRLYMVSNSYGNGFLDVIGSVAATFCIVWLCMALEPIAFFRKIGSFIGQITLPILCVHLFEINIVPLRAILERLHLPSGWIAVLAAQFVVIAVLCAVLRIIPLINRVFYPRFVRKKT